MFQLTSVQPLWQTAPLADSSAPTPVTSAFGPPVRSPVVMCTDTTLLPSIPTARGNCEFTLLEPSSWTSLSGDLGVLPCLIRVIKIPTCPSPEISHASFADGHGAFLSVFTFVKTGSETRTSVRNAESALWSVSVKTHSRFDNWT